MKLQTKIIILIAYTLLIISISCSLVLYKKYKNNESKMKQHVEKNIESKYNDMISLNEHQKQLISQLTTENKKSTKIILEIKKINTETAIQLNKLESSTESINESLIKMKKNNEILRNYYNSITKEITMSEEESE